MPVPTPWIRTYDTPELYLGGYKSGVAAGEVRQRGQIAGMDAANRLQIAQMEVAARQDIANKQLMAEEHRAAIAEQYRQAEMGLKRQEVEQQIKYQQAKIDEAAQQAAAQMRIQKRVAAGEPYERVYQEEGMMAGGGYYRPAVQRAPAKDPYSEDVAAIQKSRIESLYKDLGLATKTEQKEGVLTELWKANNDLRMNRGQARVPANPLPNDERLLVKGRVYETSQGPAIWNGKKFVTID